MGKRSLTHFDLMITFRVWQFELDLKIRITVILQEDSRHALFGNAHPDDIGTVGCLFGMDHHFIV